MYNECRKHEKEEVITAVGAEVRRRRAPYRVRSGGRGRPPAPPSDLSLDIGGGNSLTKRS